MRVPHHASRRPAAQARVGWLVEAMIDIHSHVVPDGLPFGLNGDARWPVLQRDAGYGDVVIAGRLFRRVSRDSWDMDSRREAMAAAGVTHQVLSPMPELFSYWAKPSDANRFCTAINEWTADRVHADRVSFSGLGIVPAQDIDLACDALASLKQLGLSGVELGSMVGERPVTDALYRPLFAEAERLGLCVLVHAFHPIHERYVPAGMAANGATFPIESTFAAAAVVVNGLSRGLPDLRLAFSHGGGGTALTAWRLEHLWNTVPQFAETLAESPLTTLRKFFYDSLLYDGDAIRYLVGVLGARAVCVGTDYPFFEMCAGISPLLDAVVEPATRSLVTQDNARRFLAFDPMAE